MSKGFPQRLVVLDIETIRDASLPAPKDPEKCPPPPWHEVICIGWLSLDLGDPNATACGTMTGSDERDLLSFFAAKMNADLEKSREERRDPRSMVTFGGRRFDAPVLVARCVRHGIAWPWWFSQFATRVRYKTEGHIDLCDELSEHGAATYSGLDVWARLCGLEGKSGSGSDVETMWREGKRAEVAAYCLDDVRLTAAVLLRWLVVRGDITSDEEERHRAAMTEAKPRERKAA
jgi:hypothetical protein